MKPLPTVSVTLLKAADLLVQHGHCKHVLEDEKGRICVAAAINMADHGNLYWDEGADFEAAFDRLSEYLQADPVSWNNAPERTADEVVAALRAAAMAEL